MATASSRRRTVSSSGAAWTENVTSMRFCWQKVWTEPSMSTGGFVNVIVNVQWLFHHYMCDRFCCVCVTVVCMPVNRAPAYMQYMDIVIHGLERLLGIPITSLQYFVICSHQTVSAGVSGSGMRVCLGGTRRLRVDGDGRWWRLCLGRLCCVTGLVGGMGRWSRIAL